MSIAASSLTPRSTAPCSRSSSAGPQWTNFSDLELDRYEDVQVLSRSLAEISSDFDEVYGQLARGLSTLTDNTEQFGSIVGGIQGEVTRARMVPLELLFARLRLPIRDAAMRERDLPRLRPRSSADQSHM